MTNAGIVGLGKMGILHAGILNALPDCKVVSVCEKEGMLAKKVIPKISSYENASGMVENLSGWHFIRKRKVNAFRVRR